MQKGCEKEKEYGEWNKLTWSEDKLTGVMKTRWAGREEIATFSRLDVHDCRRRVFPCRLAPISPILSSETWDPTQHPKLIYCCTLNSSDYFIPFFFILNLLSYFYFCKTLHSSYQHLKISHLAIWMCQHLIHFTNNLSWVLADWSSLNVFGIRLNFIWV